MESPRESELVVRRQDLRYRFLPLRSGFHPLAHILDASRVSNKGEGLATVALAHVVNPAQRYSLLPNSPAAPGGRPRRRAHLLRGGGGRLRRLVLLRVLDPVRGGAAKVEICEGRHEHH